MLILAIDLGTTGNRAIVFDHETQVVASSYRGFRQLFPQPGWVEHDPEEIWETTRAVVAEAVGKVDAQQIVGVGVTNQRETVVGWDPRTGKPLHNAIVWQDRRTAGRCEELKQNGLADEIHRRTGLVCDPYFSATKMEWLLRNAPATRGGIFGTIDSWIVWKLTGGRVHATDPSNASRTMLFNLRERQWDGELLKLFGVPREMLPEVRASAGEFGEVDPALFGFAATIFSVVGDQQGAMFAQGCYEPGVIKNTYGTGLFLMTNTGEEPRDSRHLLSTIAWQIGERVEYALEGSVFVGGAAVQWLRDGLQIVKTSAETESLAAGLAANDGVYFVPALTGLGAPYWDAAARGTMVGLTRATSRAHLARAALEAIAYQTRDVVDIMGAELGRPVHKLQVDGGACANNFLMQFQADVLGVPVERSAVIETTALGAAGLAGLASGVWSNPADFITHRRVERVFAPKMSTETRESLYAKWKEAVSRARSDFAWPR
ncbi:MAG TPA: glycerol kinase GlpK [Verrucomicrobiae bacterium]|nr:glycerol kinase GlpK [Verrucomicrobiae bacterium]